MISGGKLMKKRKFNLMTLLIIVFISIVLFVTFGAILIDNLMEFLIYVMTLG